MPAVQPFAAGNYRFLTHAFQYSGGVAADPGYAIERARFARPVPLAQGSTRSRPIWPVSVARRLPSAPANCARPRNLPSRGRHYVQRLEKWGLFRDDINPVARSNVCPEIDPPPEPSFYAFSYTVPGGGKSFVAAGSGEASDGPGSYAERIVRLGDQSPEGMRGKARYVLGAMERRMGALGFGWADVTATQVYTIYDIHSVIGDEFVRRGALAGGLIWHFARPPVQGLDFEVDVRGVARELVI